MRLFGHGVLDQLEREFSIVADLNRRRRAAVHDLAFAAVGLLRALQHLDLQGDGAFGIGRHILQRPGDLVGGVIHAVVARGYELDVLVQLILDGDIRGFRLVVLVADFVGDLVAHLDAAQGTGALVGVGLLLVRLFGNGVRHRLHVILGLIDDHGGAVAAVHDLAFAALGLLRGLQHPDGQGDLARLAGRHILDRPGDNAIRFRAAVSCFHKLDVLVQRIGDHNVSIHERVVLVADLVGDLVAHLDAAELAGALVGAGFFLVRHFDVAVDQVGDPPGIIIFAGRFVVLQRSRFCPEVFDFSALVIDRQSGHDDSPIVILGQLILIFERRSIRLGELAYIDILGFAVNRDRSGQLDSHGFPLARFVIVVLPDLQHGQAEAVRRVGVGDDGPQALIGDRVLAFALGIGVFGQFDGFDRVAGAFQRRRILQPGVGLLHAVHIHRQVRDIRLERRGLHINLSALVGVNGRLGGILVRHVVSQCHRDARLLIVGIQDHGHGLRPLAVLVVLVVPGLLHSGEGLFGHVGVGDLVAGHIAVVLNGLDLHLVAFRQNRLVHGVLDRRLAAVELLQLSPGVLPFIAFVQHSLVHSLVVRQQGDGDGLRTLAVLIVRVVPDLFNADLDFFGCIAVGQGGDGAVDAGIRQLIAFRHPSLIFGPGVLDFLTVGILGQVFDLRSPLFGLTQRGSKLLAFCILRRVAVSQQAHSQAFRAFAVLVLRIVPDLDDRGFGLFKRQAVGQCGDSALHAGIRQLIAFRQIDFDPGVLDFLTVGILGQVFDLGSPFTGHVQRDVFNIGAVGILGFPAVGLQAHSQAVGTFAVLIIIVVPDLLNRSLCRYGRVGVGQDTDAGLALAGVGGYGVLDRFVALGQAVFVLLPLIHDGLAIRVIDRQAGHQIGPVVVLVQGDLFDRFAVRQQGDSNALRTLAVLVVRVVPDLDDGQAEAAGLTGGIGDGRAAIFSDLEAADGVAGAFQLRHILQPGVILLDAFHILGQVLHGELPGVFIHLFEAALVLRVGALLVLVVGADREAGILLVVRQQLHGHGIGTVDLLARVLAPDLGDAGLDHRLVGVGDGQGLVLDGLLVLTVGHGGGEHLGVLVLCHDHLHVLGRGVVGHVGGGAGLFSNGVDVLTGLGEGDLAKGAGLARLDLDYGVSLGHRGVFGIARRQGEGVIRIRGELRAAAFDFLGDLRLFGDLAVGQHSQEDHSVDLFADLYFALLAFSPAFVVTFGPGIGVTVARGIHLIHTDRHRGPVVLLGQSEGFLEVFVLNTVHRAGQGHFQLIAFRDLTVDQPLLGDRDAILAGGVSVDEEGFRAALSLSSAAIRSRFRRGRFTDLNCQDHVGERRIQELHRVDIHIGITGGSALIVRDLDDLIAAGGQVLDLERRAGGDGEDRLLIAQLAAVAGDPQGLVAQLLDGYIEGTAIVQRVDGAGLALSGLGHQSAVDQHVLADFQLAGLARVGVVNRHFRRRILVFLGQRYRVGRDRGRQVVAFRLGGSRLFLDAVLAQRQVVPDDRFVLFDLDPVRR